MQKLYQLVPQRGRDASQRAGNGGATGSETRSSVPSSTETRTAAPTNTENRSAGPARAQAGLSVNDFISKTKNQQRQGVKPSGPELIAYARYLGIDPVADHDLLWIAVEALEAPLPSDWTEHFDSNDRVFYYNATTRVSSWTHPLEVVYRDTYKVIVTFRNSNMPPAERHEKLHELQYEVSQMEKDVHKEIGQWSEHSDEQGNRFYFNKEERQSTWTDPRPAKCQILHLRQKMLHLLQSNAGATAGFSDGKVESSSRFGPLSGSRLDSELPATKHAKLGGSSVEDHHRSTDGRSEVPSDHQNSDSDSDEDRKKKKKKKKKKKDKKEKGSDSDAVLPVKLGTPYKLNTSYSEPSVGYNNNNNTNTSNSNSGHGNAGSGASNAENHAGPLSNSAAGGYGSNTATGSSSNRDATNGAGETGSGGYLGRGSPRSSAAGSNHPAWSALSPLDESGLSTAGRTRVKAGIRLEPLAPVSAEAPAAATSSSSSATGGPPSGTAVRSSASVPAL
mmetsp:Transcript_81506/g.179235  ORF Transcript_81506/g.179235 Transcript_81506/m.179235 type:complete len:505 (-) Transcript_81506:84-1598(-)|eukprot:CAMPEP_0206612280 /NCGR_PEP_ID=MMETSP0325_2-20121206/55869_1 /ASSEMBLY_ACC=CAM_ASM_000347 /TAXON_ID=2866 /ORGANISM="Crypthecodinium cohnii, Strain Seligo" /LENGTH=504 /DNA_ID=CAMNT_0054131889 /DNA_START=78 /DNA_END=1592 /DNA_ORIENTATION=-